MSRIPLGHLSYLVPVSRISLSLSQVGRLSWSHIQGNSGDFPMQSSGFVPISRLFPHPFPDISSFPFAPSKVCDLFPLRLGGPVSFLATKPGGGAGGVSEATPRRMRVLQWSAGGRIRPEDPNSTSSLTPKRSFPPGPSRSCLLPPVADGDHQLQSLLQGCSHWARSPGILTPPFGLPSSLPTRSARGSAALPAGLRRGGDEASGRSGVLGKEGAARLRCASRRPGAPEPARARTSRRLGRREAGGAEGGAGGGAAGRAGGAIGGRSEGWEGARERSGGRVASPPASAAVAFARNPEADQRPADGLGSSPCAGGQPQRSSGLAACFPARPRPPRLRRPRRAPRAGGAGATLRCSVPALLSPGWPPRRGPERRPGSPASRRLLRATVLRGSKLGLPGQVSS